MIDDLLLTHGHRTRHVTLFLHGFTASPLQFVDLANHAHAMGDNVYVPCLPRHGEDDRLTQTLGHLRASELLEHVERSLTVALSLGESVRVVGFSLGGLLAAWIAQRHDVRQAIAVAPLLGLAAVPPACTNAFARALLRFPNVFVWWDPILRERQLPAHGYPRFPTHGLAQLLLIADDVFQYAARHAARSPIAFVTNAGEAAVNNRAIAKLARMWQASGPARVEQHLITGLGLSHDIIEPLRPRAGVDKSYPV